MKRLIAYAGWIGAAAMVAAPPLIDSSLGKTLAIFGLALLTTQAVSIKQYNLVALNVLGIAGYAFALA